MILAGHGSRSIALTLGVGEVPGSGVFADTDEARLVAAHIAAQNIRGISADLDSLADIVSFGVAPAVLGFALGLRGGWDAVILTYFVACGIGRLARFGRTCGMMQKLQRLLHPSEIFR